MDSLKGLENAIHLAVYFWEIKMSTPTICLRGHGLGFGTSLGFLGDSEQPSSDYLLYDPIPTAGWMMNVRVWRL